MEDVKLKKIIRVAALSDSLRILLKGQLRHINTQYEVLAVGSGKESALKLTAEEGVKATALRIERRISPVQDVISLFKLYLLFRREKPFLVHSITPKAGLLSMIAAFFARVPHRAHTFTGLVFPTATGFFQKLLIFFDKVICFCATNIYPEGQGVKNDLLNYKITKKKLTVIGHGNVNGIDLTHFDPLLFNKQDNLNLRHSSNLTNEDFVFLFVGRFAYDKGICELVNAFIEVQKEFSTAKLVLVGTFEKEHDPLPESIFNEIENNSGIICAGWQTDVRPYFSIANVFILPSYREGFPNVVLQAGAMGKYCIVTDINGSNEIIENGTNGKIIPVNDSISLQKEMVACLNNKDLHEKYNTAYRKIISDKYEQSFVWNALLEEYQKMD